MIFSKKSLGILIISLTALTVLFNLATLAEPQLIGYYQTSNGIVEYFSSNDPSFVIKAYLNGSAQPALISVFVNLPNNITFLEENFTQSLTIPFSKLKPYMKHWIPWAKKVNTSLLVIVSYFNGTNVYSSAEEVEYSPLWIINNKGIQIVAEVNVIGKKVPINWTIVKQRFEKLRNELLKHKTKDPGSNPYIINVGTQDITDLKSYTILKYPYIYSYQPDFDEYVIYNISIPISWVGISNGVLQNDNFTSVWLLSYANGNVSWYAISNSSNYGGPYIGVSFSANVNWYDIGIHEYKYQLREFNNPYLYVYYNATIVVAQYTVWEEVYEGRSTSLPAPVSNVTVFEVLWATPDESGGSGGAIENSGAGGGGVLIYLNGYPVSGLNIGNGTINFYFDYMRSENNISVQDYAWVYWNNGNVSYVGYPVSTLSEAWAIPMSYVYIVNTAEYLTVANAIISTALPITLSVLAAILCPACSPWLGVLISIGVKIALFFFFPQSSSYSYFLQETQLEMGVGNMSGQVYVTVLNYSVLLPIPALGFILNYSNFYYPGG